MLIFAASLAVLVYGLMSPLLGVWMPLYGLSHEQQGSLGLANAAGLAIASLLAGPLVDLKGKKAGMILGLSLIVVALMVAPSTSTYAWLLVLYFTLGFGGGVVITSANALSRDIEPGRRASVLNFMNLFFGLGGIMTTYMASYVVSVGVLCYAIAGLGCFALAANARVRRRAGESTAGVSFSEARELVLQPRLFLFSLILLLYVACEVGVWNWFKAYLISMHFDARTAGGVVSYGFGFGMLTGRFTASRIINRIGPANALLGCGVLTTLTTLLVLNVFSESSVTIALFAAGFSMAPVFPTTLAMVADAFPNVTATAIGIAITSGWLGLAISSPVIGLIAGRSDLRSGLFLLPALAFAMVLVSVVLNPGQRSSLST